MSARWPLVVAAAAAAGMAPPGPPAASPSPPGPCHLQYAPSDTTHSTAVRSEAEYTRLLAASTDPRITSVKFTIDRQDASAGPERWVVYYQNTTALPYHVDFASRFVPGLKDKGKAEIDRLVDSGQGARYIFGALIYRPCRGGAPAAEPAGPAMAAFDVSLPAEPSAEVVAHARAAVVRSAPFVASRLLYFCRVPARCGPDGDVTKAGVESVTPLALFR